MSNLARIIRTFESNPKFTIEDKLVEFEGRPDSNLYLPEVNYDRLTEVYGLQPNDFREKVAVLVNPEELTSENPNYGINWVTSIDVRAANSGKYFGNTEPFSQLAAIGLTITKDNQIVVGLRGGEINPERIQQYASGLWGLAPGGSVTFPEPVVDVELESYFEDLSPVVADNLISETLQREFNEELGEFEIKDMIKLLGVFEAYRPGPTGIKFAGEIRTDATLKHIQETNINGNKLYQNLILKGTLKKDIGYEFERMKLPIDSWGYLTIIGIPNDTDSIRRFLAQPQNLAGICVGPLELYLLSL